MLCVVNCIAVSEQTVGKANEHTAIFETKHRTLSANLVMKSTSEMPFKPGCYYTIEIQPVDEVPVL